MNLQEAITRYRKLKYEQEIISNVCSYLQRFLSVEMDNPSNVIWMDDGGRVPEEALTDFLRELEQRSSSIQQELEVFLGAEVNNGTEERPEAPGQ